MFGIDLKMCLSRNVGIPSGPAERLGFSLSSIFITVLLVTCVKLNVGGVPYYRSTFRFGRNNAHQKYKYFCMQNFLRVSKFLVSNDAAKQVQNFALVVGNSSRGPLPFVQRFFRGKNFWNKFQHINRAPTHRKVLF